MKQQRSDCVSVGAREPVEVFSRQIVESSQNDPAHPIEL
jgi:hypothetical protein